MSDDKSLEAHSHKIQKIAHEIITKGMPLNEHFQVAVVVDKLSRSWKDLKKKKKLITCLRIEEEAKKEDKKDDMFIVYDNNTKKKFTFDAR